MNEPNATEATLQDRLRDLAPALPDEWPEEKAMLREAAAALDAKDNRIARQQREIATLRGAYESQQSEVERLDVLVHQLYEHATNSCGVCDSCAAINLGGDNA